MVVFVATWALHAYQSFWLRGTWGFSVPDALFWGVLGVLVLVNVQLDARRSRGRAAGPRRRRPRRRGPRAGRPRRSRRPARSPRSPCSGRSGRAPASAAWLDLLQAGASGASDKEPDRDGDDPIDAVAAARIGMLQSAALLAVAFVPWPAGWAGRPLA